MGTPLVLRSTFFLGAEPPRDLIALAVVIVWRHWLLGWAGLALLTLLRFGRLAFVAVGAFAFLLIDLPITLDGQEARLPRLAAKG